nr:serine/threonine-protein kinase STY46-like isoform X3 [Tanacetum cinerariifolium]
MVIYGGGGDTESSCSSRVPAAELTAVQRRRRPKVEVFEEVLRRLRESECEEEEEEVNEEGFEEELWSHFNRLPLRYALDVNIERAQEVLMHKKLLQMAHDPKTRPAFEARLIQNC